MGQRYHPQHPLELQKLGTWVKGANSILEIGSRYGENLKFLAAFMHGNRIVSVDLPDVEGWNDPNVGGVLKGVVKHLGQAGYDITLIIGDSHHPDTLANVSKHSPFDVVFIDGDHSYEGVKEDYEFYGGMGKQVIFHDINPQNGLGVAKFWAELKGQTESFIASGSTMGIGRIL